MGFLFLIHDVGWAHIKGILGDTEDLYSISLYLCDFSIGVLYLQAPKLYASCTVYSSAVTEIQLSELMLLHSCYVIWFSRKDNNYLLQEIELVIECIASLPH
jgi:hypothetical protein